MNKLRNEQGYTLIIVLLIITLLLAFAATFMATSMNHSRQEQTVEAGNQAVAAAEMGVQYFTLHIDEQIRDAFIKVRNDVIEPMIGQLDMCLENGGSYGSVQCSNQEEFDAYIRSIISESDSRYREEIQMLYPESPTPGDPASTKTFQPDGSEVRFYLSRYIPQPGDTPDEIKLELTIAGEADERQEKLMTTVLISVPDFIHFINEDDPEDEDDFVKRDIYEVLFARPIAHQKCLPLASLTPPYNCNLGTSTFAELIAADSSGTLLPKLNVLVEDFGTAVCKDNNCTQNLHGMTIYAGTSEEDVSVMEQNLNKLQNFTLVQEGTLDFEKNANNSDANFIVGSITSEGNLNNIDGYILVMGNRDGTGTFDFDKNFKTDSDGKVCLNLDGLSTIDGNYNTGGSSGELVYFSSQGKTFPGGARFNGTLEEFVEHCTGSPINLIEFTGDLPAVGTDNAVVEVRVDY